MLPARILRRPDHTPSEKFLCDAHALRCRPFLNRSHFVSSSMPRMPIFREYLPVRVKFFQLAPLRHIELMRQPEKLGIEANAPPALRFINGQHINGIASRCACRPAGLTSTAHSGSAARSRESRVSSTRPTGSVAFTASLPVEFLRNPASHHATNACTRPCLSSANRPSQNHPHLRCGAFTQSP